MFSTLPSVMTGTRRMSRILATRPKMTSGPGVQQTLASPDESHILRLDATATDADAAVPLFIIRLSFNLLLRSAFHTLIIQSSSFGSGLTLP